MQELLYLSDAKLRQFVPEGRRRTRIGRRLTGFRLEATTPVGGGGLEVGLAQGAGDPQGADRLTAVVEQIEEHALWYGDPEARAGRWVYFEAPLNTVVHRDTVLFLDAPAARSDVREHGGPLLFLHGSSGHLLAGAPEVSVGPRALGVNGSALNLTARDLWQAWLPDADDMTQDMTQAPAVRVYPRALHMLLRASNRNPGSAAWMCGYARVTLGVLPGEAEADERRPVLLATPLYVEYAHDLPR
jgi:hypothetical protein